MPDTKKKKQSQTSDMVGLPKEVESRNKAITKAGSTGPRYKENKTPLKQETMKTTSKMKSAGAKAKPSSPMMQKKDMMGKKMAPTKMKKC
jgi:hypothetical protein